MKHRAFTLLEVLVALAILGVSLLAIIQINGQAVNSHVYARKLTIATMLARSKMTDLEQKLYDEGFSLDDDEDSGDFSSEGWPAYKWRSKIIAPKTSGLKPEQLLGAVFNLPMGDGKGDEGGLGAIVGSMFGGGGKKDGLPGDLLSKAIPGAAGASGGGDLLGAMGPMGAMFTQMIDQIQNTVREVHLTVTWKEGKATESIDLVTHVVALAPGGDRNGGGTAGGAAPGGLNQPSAGGQFMRPDGTPARSPRPGPGGQMVDDDGALLVPSQAGFPGGAMGPGGASPFPVLTPPKSTSPFGGRPTK